MSDRVTVVDLRHLTERLNDNSNREYELDYAYSGVKLTVKTGVSGRGDITGYEKKPHLYAILNAILSYKSAEKHV